MKLNGYLPAILIVFGMVFTGMASYWTNRVSITSAIGDRPTRAEVQQQLTEIKETIVREVKDIKDQQETDAENYTRQQWEVRQDIRELTKIVIERLR